MFCGPPTGNPPRNHWYVYRGEEGFPDAVNTAPTQRLVVGFIIAVGFGLTVITIEFDCTEHKVLEFVMIQ